MNAKDREITKDDSISIKNYFKEIRKFEVLSSDEQKELLKRAKEGDKAAEAELIKTNQKFIVSIAKDYQNTKIPLPDLISEGNLGLLRAIDKFDLKRTDIRFLSYAVWWIRQAMLQSIYNDSNTVRFPVNRINQTNKVSKIEERLMQTLNREPTAGELGELAELSEEDIASASEGYTHLSLDAEISEDGETTLIDLIENDSQFEVESKMNGDSLRYEINSILQTLTERERTILEMYFGLNGSEEQTLREIGFSLGLTNERVRQIKEFAIKKLRSFSKSSKLKEFLSMK